MTSLLKYSLHQMVDYASKENVISACNVREDVCRFLLHSFFDYMTDHGRFDNSFEVLIDWSQTLGIKLDEKSWKAIEQQRPKSRPVLSTTLTSGSESQSRSRPPPKISVTKRINNKNADSNGSVTPVDDESDHTDREQRPRSLSDDNKSATDKEDEVTAEREKFQRYSNASEFRKPRTSNFLLTRHRARSHGNPTMHRKKQRARARKKRMKRKNGQSGGNLLDVIRKEHFLTVSSTSPANTPDRTPTPRYASTPEAMESPGDDIEYAKLTTSSIVESPNSSSIQGMDSNAEISSVITPATVRERAWTNESEMSLDPNNPTSEWNRVHQRKWSLGSLSDRDEKEAKDRVAEIDYVHSKIQVHERKSSVSIGDHERNLIMAPHRQDILSNIEEDEKYSISRSAARSVISTTQSSSYVSLSDIAPKPIDYLSKLSHVTWMTIAQYLNTSSKAAGLGLVNREMNLLCFHPLCWKKLCIKIDNLTKLSLNVMRRSFKNLTRFELNWNNPETPLSLLCGDYGTTSRINSYMATKYSKEIELFFSNLSSVCNSTLHTFKLSLHGGPYRLANSAPTSIKIFQTETLLRLCFANFSNLRKFKMDAYNLIAVDVFNALLQTYTPSLQFFEAQIVTQRVILENPVSLNQRNILPSTLKHLCLPLLADDSWIINQSLPHLEYLFFFGYTRSSGYALHENFLSIRCLDYIAGNKSTIPNCPKIRIIEIALRQNDYYTIVLRPIIRKLFSRCKYLESVKLATAGNMDLAHSLSSSLYASNLQCCHVFAKDEGRPEKPIGVVECRRNPNYKVHHNKMHSVHSHHLSVPTVTSDVEETISEMEFGGRLRTI